MPSARCSASPHTGQSGGNDHGADPSGRSESTGPHHLGNHLAGPAHDDGVAGTHVLGRHLVLVVERGSPHRHPAHEHWLQPGEGGRLARRADRHLDVEQLGGPLLGRELVGDRPAGRLGVHAQPGLGRQVVDLDNHAVELVVQVVAAPFEVHDVGLHRGQVGQAGRVLVHGQSQRRKPLQRLHMGGEGRAAVGVAELVAPERQAPLGRHPGILLSQRTGGCVAGIDVSLLAPLGLAGVETLEGGETQDHLSPHLQHRRSRPPQADRDIGDGAHRVGDVLAGAAIAPGRGPHQHAVLVADRYRQSVELQLHRELAYTGVLHGRQRLLPSGVGRASSQSAVHPLMPRPQLLDVEGVVQRHHGRLVGHRRKHGVIGRGPDPLGGRVGVDQLRVPCLQGLQLVEQVVEVGVGDLGLARVVQRRVVVEQGLQLANTGRGVGGRAHAGTGRIGHSPRLHLRRDRFATCPITQGTLLRFLLRNGMEAGRAAAVLRMIVSLPEHVFWPDEIGFDASVLRSVVGHRQVTDSYLVALARHFGGSLVTFDRALAALHPATARLIPA